jgi:phosphopantothenoylcysteine decarboxylase/phosphopantothenate--cysteine ligase
LLSPVFFSTNNWREENIGAFYIRFFLIKIILEMRGKKIILGITGSIAAYKAAYLVRAFIKKGAEVQVVITPAGKEFITPVTLSALTGKPVVSEFFTANDGTWHSHVDLGLWADAMVIAPATASTIGKMANGIADNMLITTYLSAKAPVFIAPAMDLDMFAHPSTQHNLDLLRSYGNHIIEPGVGELASHLEGKGRMEEPDKIVAIIEKFFSVRQELAGKKIIITAGPTYEKIDPVRFIGNYSSGKMGFALAEECAARGAEVTLIAGPVSLKIYHSSIRRIDVESAREMYDVVLREYPGADAAIMCAAVADYAPDHCSDIKIKRSGDDMVLRLQPNPDIAAALGKIKRQNQVLAGFALETDNEEEHARSKMKRKNLDFIVLNSLKDAGAGFRCDTNKVTILTRDGEKIPFEVKPKKEVASDIISVLSGYMK